MIDLVISWADTEAGGNADGELKEEEEAPEYAILEEEELSERKPTDPAEQEKKEKKSVSVEKEEKEKKAFESEEDEEKMMDATPAEVLDACVVKYSVKTTPFLQRWRFSAVFLFICLSSYLLIYLIWWIFL